MIPADDLFLRLSAPHVTSAGANFRLPSWPPPPDFPLLLDAKGQVISRFAHSTWSLSLIAGHACVINFGDGPTSGRRIDPGNASLFRLAVLWFMYGERRGISPTTLKYYAALLKTVFACCAGLDAPILASELSRFPRVVEGPLAAAVAPSVKAKTIALLHELYQVRERVGFTLLTPPLIAALANAIPEPEEEQTPFVPPRIWLYQAARLTTFLEDFRAHQTQIVGAFTTVVDAYRQNFGSLAIARSERTTPARSPFASKVVLGTTKLGNFPEFAAKRGIAELLARWCLRPGQQWDASNPRHSIVVLGRYFNMVGVVGTAHLQCFSGMRIAEAMSLRTKCLEIEDDPQLGTLYSLRAVTKKTTKDDDARWVTAPRARLAVEAMSCIAHLRTAVAAELPGVSLTDLDREDPYLVQLGYEPWCSLGREESIPPDIRPTGYGIGDRSKRASNLFDPEQMRVQPEDERIARLITPSLDLSRYGVGQVWPLSSHEYRRSVAVNMSASDAVSDPSQQMQLKHLVRAQSAYYGRGFTHLGFNQAFATELISTRYEMTAKEVPVLAGEDWVSPHGEDRKEAILLRFYSVDSSDEIERNARKGLLSIKQTLFGVCTRRDHCPYGGHENFVHCPSCVDALLDRRKRPAIEAMGRTLAIRLIDVPMGTPLRDLLETQTTATEEALHVIA